MIRICFCNAENCKREVLWSTEVENAYDILKVVQNVDVIKEPGLDKSKSYKYAWSEFSVQDEINGYINNLDIFVFEVN